MGFDPTFLTQPTASQQFTIISNDLPLTVFFSFVYLKGISYFFIAISVLALILFFVGSYFYKMIGVESLCVIQFMSFFRIVIFNQSLLFNSFSDLQYSTAYS